MRAQTFVDWEHIVVDDGSDDGTAQMMAERSRNDPRVRYMPRTGEKPGANVCRNLGVRAARADLVLFLDSDDLLDVGCLTRRVEVMARNADLDFATFQTGVFVNTVGDLGRQLDENLLGDDLVRFLYFEAPWIITGPIWRRETLLRLGGFDERLVSWQDIELHVRALCAHAHYLRFPNVDHHVRWQNDPSKTSIEQRRSPRHLKGAVDVLDSIERHVRQGPGVNWTRRQGLASLYFFVAEHWVIIGELREGLRFWREIRKRRLGGLVLYASGVAMLLIKASGAPSARLIHKWRSWMKLRNQPELVPGQPGF